MPFFPTLWSLHPSDRPQRIPETGTLEPSLRTPSHSLSPFHFPVKLSQTLDETGIYWNIYIYIGLGSMFIHIWVVLLCPTESRVWVTPRHGSPRCRICFLKGKVSSFPTKTSGGPWFSNMRKRDVCCFVVFLLHRNTTQQHGSWVMASAGDRPVPLVSVLPFVARYVQKRGLQVGRDPRKNR